MVERVRPVQLLRPLRIAGLTAGFVATAALAGVPGLAADEPSEPVSSGSYVSQLDCGSQPIVVINDDGEYVPPRPGQRQTGPASDRQALDEFLREEGIRLGADAFGRSRASARSSQFVGRRDGAKVATALVEAVGVTYHVADFAACDREASR